MGKARSRRLSNVLPNRKSVVTLPRQVLQVGRNDPCPCGSGKKYKQCHIGEGEAFLQKLAQERERKRRKEAVGRPWYLRLFR